MDFYCFITTTLIIKRTIISYYQVKCHILVKEGNKDLLFYIACMWRGGGVWGRGYCRRFPTNQQSQEAPRSLSIEGLNSEVAREPQSEASDASSLACFPDWCGCYKYMSWLSLGLRLWNISLVATSGEGGWEYEGHWQLHNSGIVVLFKKSVLEPSGPSRQRLHVSSVFLAWRDWENLDFYHHDHWGLACQRSSWVYEENESCRHDMSSNYNAGWKFWDSERDAGKIHSNSPSSPQKMLNWERWTDISQAK